MARINFKHTFTFERRTEIAGCEGEVEFEVELTCCGTQAVPAVHYPNDKAHPDEPAEVEVISRRIRETGCKDEWRTPDDIEDEIITEWIDEHGNDLEIAMDDHVASENADAEDRAFDQWRDDMMGRD